MRYGINGMYFTPLSEDLVIGFGLNSDLIFNITTNTTDDGYTTAGEVVKTLELDNSYTVSPSVSVAFPIGELNAGFRLYSYNYFDTVKEEFEQTTDSAVNGGSHALYWSCNIKCRVPERYFREFQSWTG